jgi:hypothetical protein
VWVRSIAVALVLAAACVAFVPARGDHGDPALLGDSITYVAMVRGSPGAPPPFRYRAVVPALARALPLAPEHALAIVSLISLIAAYALVLQTSQRLGLSLAAASTGLVVAASTAPHLYLYENPYLTDATGVLVAAACLHALVVRRFSWFVGLCAIGMGVRETTFFAAPGWAATRQWWRAVLTVVTSLAAYVVLHRWIGPLSDADAGPFAEFPARPWHDAGAELLRAWHLLWLATPIGLCLLSSRRADVCWMGGLLSIGTAATSLLASDTTRMAEPLFPVVVIGTSASIAMLWKFSKSLAALFVGAAVASARLWEPLHFVTPATVAGERWHVILATLAVAAVLAGAAELYERRHRIDMLRIRPDSRAERPRALGVRPRTLTAFHDGDSTVRPS